MPRFVERSCWIARLGFHGISAKRHDKELAALSLLGEGIYVWMSHIYVPITIDFKFQKLPIKIKS